MRRDHLQGDGPRPVPRTLPEGFVLAAVAFGAFLLVGLLVAAALQQTSVLTAAVVSTAVVLPVVWFLSPEEP